MRTWRERYSDFVYPRTRHMFVSCSFGIAECLISAGILTDISGSRSPNWGYRQLLPHRTFTGIPLCCLDSHTVRYWSFVVSHAWKEKRHDVCCCFQVHQTASFFFFPFFSPHYQECTKCFLGRILEVQPAIAIIYVSEGIEVEEEEVRQPLILGTSMNAYKLVWVMIRLSASG